MGKLSEINKQYQEIVALNQSEEERDEALAELMKEMERQYQIPVILNPDWEWRNKAVSVMYHVISQSRTVL
ncbi:hypothetical protein [Alicyclobacillus sp. SO9]|uniref:hypothetical protein n=1 Tax=Alicyclobacillus sp. SO9 TaxID=2665646 RepID=UPI0018E8671A|nr:hypothetical protein [Alicyclobacillus sp. SO9]QQE79508.1 hypothetical protein GI364_03155 [Alicyclobacillus sp. SO9]